MLRRIRPSERFEKVSSPHDIFPLASSNFLQLRMKLQIDTTTLRCHCKTPVTSSALLAISLGKVLWQRHQFFPNSIDPGIYPFSCLLFPNRLSLHWWCFYMTICNADFHILFLRITFSAPVHRLDPTTICINKLPPALNFQFSFRFKRINRHLPFYFSPNK